MMMTHLGDMDEEFDEGVVADHLRGSEGSSFGDPGCIPLQGFDKNTESNWVNMIAQQGASLDATSPQTASHLSPELNIMSDLTTFEYGQRLPSLESSSSAPLGRISSGLAAHSIFSWHPFGSTPAHSQGQVSSLHGPGGHLFPVIPGSTGNYGGLANSPTPANSLPNTTNQPERHPKNESQYSYSNKPRTVVLSPVSQSPCSSDMQAFRLGMIIPNPHSPATAPVPIYAPTATSSNTCSSAPSHQQAFCSPSSSSNSNPFNTPPNHALQDSSKAVILKQRSKKESHNRIERKRRDYINSQIVYLSSLLPPELYRDVDGRRNKGSVLRLSVNYIMELREAVSRMASLKQENNLAQQLIPLLIQRIESLEKAILDQGGNLGNLQSTQSSSNPALKELHSLESIYQSWLVLSEANQRGCNGSTTVCPTTSASHNTGGSNGSRPLNQPSTQSTDSRYMHDLLKSESAADIDLTSVKSGHMRGNRLVNVKREHSEEEIRPDECGRSDPMNMGRGCGSRPSYTTDLSVSSDRIEEEVASQDGSFESRPNSAYERYQHSLPQPSQSGVFQQNH